MDLGEWSLGRRFWGVGSVYVGFKGEWGKETWLGSGGVVYPFAVFIFVGRFWQAGEEPVVCCGRWFDSMLLAS